MPTMSNMCKQKRLSRSTEPNIIWNVVIIDEKFRIQIVKPVGFGIRIMLAITK